MIMMRLLFGVIGALICGLVVWAVRVGWYPSHGERISRTANPIAFWSIISVSALLGVGLMVVAMLV